MDAAPVVEKKMHVNWVYPLLAVVLMGLWAFGSNQIYSRVITPSEVNQSLADMRGHTRSAAMQDYGSTYQLLYVAGWSIVTLAALLLAKNGFRVYSVLFLCALAGTGCQRPFKPVKLEAIESHEVAFLIPFTEATEAQASVNNEDFFSKNLVKVQQVTIPQQWVPKGYEYFGSNGEWRDAAVLIKVDTATCTREWTADPNSGTSNKNEAIWVMTSDQVEFSTGWTISARVENRDSAVKFLANYPNGSLSKVLDTEVRGKLQAVFGLEVTDLPMETLRKQATPHIEKTVKDVKTFFAQRGITITNLGITGGFVYKDKSIQDTLVKVFNAEQEKSMAVAKTAAQEEMNKRIILEATGKADALLKEKKAEAEGIKAVADAKFYELEKSKQNLEDYVVLKQLELQKELLARWDGAFPVYFMGAGGQSPNMLLQLPGMPTDKKPHHEKPADVQPKK